MALYERVARNGGDSELLLDFLEKRAQLAGATPSQIREAVDMAVELGQGGRAEGLLGRAVDAAARVERWRGRRGVGGCWRWPTCGSRPATWPAPRAGLRGGQHRRAGADRAAGRAAGRGRRARPTWRWRRRCTSSCASGARPIARWEPLVELYQQAGDGDRLASVVSSTLPNLLDVGERNAAAPAHARFLIERLNRPHDASDVLRDALTDDPDDLEAAELLGGQPAGPGRRRRPGRVPVGAVRRGAQRGNRASTIDVAMRLGAQLEGTGAASGKVYRQALAVAPDDLQLLRGAVATIGPDDDGAEAAALMERLLAVETAEQVPTITWHLVTAYQEAQDWAGVQRVLVIGHRARPRTRRSTIASSSTTATPSSGSRWRT
ncbi:MAG: hypothetical protein IPH44_38905 [Myxococcales bacterium]|nr:hypothetical protein [Myxococcales bacterium]